MINFSKMIQQTLVIDKAQKSERVSKPKPPSVNFQLNNNMACFNVSMQALLVKMYQTTIDCLAVDGREYLAINFSHENQLSFNVDTQNADLIDVGEAYKPIKPRPVNDKGQVNVSLTAREMISDRKVSRKVIIDVDNASETVKHGLFQHDNDGAVLFVDVTKPRKANPDKAVSKVVK